MMKCENKEKREEGREIGQEKKNRRKRKCRSITYPLEIG
jgi:hypothetical protein